MRTLAVVSARYESTRFPGKMLHNLMGKPLIDWSIDYCKKAKFFDDIVVATDSNKIKEHINSNFENIKVIKIDGEIRCATERLFRVFELLNSDYYMYISIPADEPFVDPTEIDRLRKEILNEELTMTKIGWIYHYCAIPDNPNAEKTLYWMKKTYEHFYGELND